MQKQTTSQSWPPPTRASNRPKADQIAVTVTVLLAGAVAAALLTAVLGGARASHAGVRSRAGTIAFLRREVGVHTGLFAIEADGSDLRRLTPSGLDVTAFEWAPDGSRIAYLDRHGALRIVRSDGKGAELLAANSP